MAASCFLRPFSGCTLSCKSSLPMVATRGRTFKRPWRRSCLSSKLKSSSAPIGRKDSWCFHAVGSSNAPLLGSTAAEGLPRIGRTSIATRWRFCGLPQSASCSENFVIPPDVFGQTLRGEHLERSIDVSLSAALEGYELDCQRRRSQSICRCELFCSDSGRTKA
jgi:hypothetical protein